jgi:hypothetical protein
MDRATIIIVTSVGVSEEVADGICIASLPDPIAGTTRMMFTETGCGPVIMGFPEPVGVTWPFYTNPMIALAS